ncbi:hypothetical protein [Schaalia suimastitidis]|uniref:hypothetical protein n=1 Tax=Schaalia suimastitidis TaxID=121163 RepID=UPI000418A1F3|nr:hypothetical protein [Schaalia suimastitidis]
MLNTGFEKSADGAWGTYTYQATFRYGWDVALAAAQFLIARDFTQIDRVIVGSDPARGTNIVAEVQAANGDLSQTSAAQENGCIIVSGVSRLMECPVQLTFYNQTNAIQLNAFLPKMPPEERDNPQAFTNYVSSIEIGAHVSLARARS